MDDQRRYNDLLLGKMEGKLDLLIQEIENYKKDAKEWRTSVDARFKPIEEFIYQIQAPSKALKAAFIIVGSGILLSLTGGVMKWFYDHWK